MHPTTAVIYLWAPDDATAETTFDELAATCEDYAFRFCWEVVDTVRDVGGSNEYFDHRMRVSAFDRTGLDRVLALLKEKQAIIVLTADASMIGGTNLVFHAVCDRVEKYGGFVQVVSGTADGADHAPTVEAG